MHQTSASNQDPFYAQKSYPEPVVAAAAEMQAAVVAAKEVFADADPVEKVQVVEETIYRHKNYMKTLNPIFEKKV